nr:hypothetical protein [Polyangiaceae bacterium]
GVGGTGGTEGGIGGSGGGSISCGATQCPSYVVAGLITMSACCASPQKCGAIVDATIGGLLGGMPQGCYETGQAGNPDCGCPSHTFNNPITQGQATFPGCCQPSGNCGYVIDVSGQSGPNIGCQLATWGSGQGKTCTPGAGSACDGGIADAATD